MAATCMSLAILGSEGGLQSAPRALLDHAGYSALKMLLFRDEAIPVFPQCVGWMYELWLTRLSDSQI